MNKITTTALIVVALIVGLAGGYLFEKARATAKLEDFKLSMQKQMDDSMKVMDKTMQPTPATGSVMMMAKTGDLTDAKGMTLYTFDKDTKDVSNCTGKCLVNWPPFMVSGQAPTALPANVGTFKKADGSMQYTFKGMPLYYYIGDKNAGDTTGDGVGGVWHVVK